jgi:hypothetical protein
VRLEGLDEVRFDDRLLTVLSQPAGDRHDAAVRWRQLVDLVARAGPQNGSFVIAQAIDTIRSEAPAIDEELRAAAARAIAARPLPYGLLEYFVSDRLSVSAPILAAATLDSPQWQALLVSADEETRRFVETLHPEAAPSLARSEQHSAVELPTVPVEEPHVIAPPRTATTPLQTSSLSEVVARIERRRRNRDAQRYSAGGASAEDLPEEPPSLFRWECGPGGEIAWVEGAPRGALVGRSLARIMSDDNDRLDEDVVRAFTMRAPFRDAEMTVTGEGLVAGSWRISGLPAFDPTDGRFAGYRGIALRDSTPVRSRRDPIGDILTDPASVRELVHEIKTPLNAIIGFAEIIDGQYLGPADHRYRERARDIVSQARLLLGAIDDLDFAAKVNSGVPASRRVDLAQLVAASAEPIERLASSRGVELELGRVSMPVVATLDPQIAERLLIRFASAVIERAGSGERLLIATAQDDSQCRIALSRPEELREIPDSQLFDSVPDAGGKGEAFDLPRQFSLRLVRGLARVAGGDLVTSPASLILVFPRA